MNKRICHISSIHNRYDTRVLYRECTFLSKKGHDVYLLINDGEKDEEINGVKIQSVKKLRSTIKRKLIVPVLFYNRIRKLKPSVVHFHDPELIPFGLFLNGFTKMNVIFDVHENFKAYSKRSFYQRYLSWLNKIAAKRLKLIYAEESYHKNYPPETSAITVLNYPDISFFNEHKIQDFGSNTLDITYIGGVNRDRGLRETIDALAEIESQRPHSFGIFHIVGPARSESELEYIKGGRYAEIESKVVFYGRLKLTDAYKIANKSKIGVAITLPSVNYKESISTKVLEYMAIGLPQVYSNFKVYDFLKKNNTGLAVEPTTKEIYKALNKLITDSNLLQSMHENSLDSIHLYTAENELNKLNELIGKL